MDSFIGKIRSAFIGCALSSMLAGCGGGGGAASNIPAAPVSPNAVSVSSTAMATASNADVALVINVPASSGVQTQSVGRSLEYISSSTKSASIAVTNAGTNVQNMNVNCTKTCSATLQIPVGVDTFSISLFDAANASGSVLAKGSAIATIARGTVNKVSVVFDGVPATLSLNVAPAVWTAGKAATSTISVSAYDAGGNLIVGTQNYASAIAINDTDTTGSTTLSTTSIVSPSATATLRYNGSNSLKTLAVNVADGVRSATAQVAVNVAPAPIAPTPAPAATVPAAPGTAARVASNVPQHVMTYQEQLGSNQATPFGSNYGGIAPYITYALTDPVAAPAMRSAGVKVGFYATVHTICVPQVYGECTPQASQAPSAVWARNCNGDQVTFSSPGAGLVQFQTDPTSPALATLFNTVIATTQLNNGSPVKYDFVFDDNANVPGSNGYETFYDYVTGAPASPQPYCNYSDANYIAGMRTLYNTLTLPAIANAFNAPDSAPAASPAVQYLSSPNLWGGMMEYIYGSSVNGNARLKESGNIWQSEENTQLAVSNAHRLFIGYEHVGGTDAAGLDERLYVYASLLLSFDAGSLVMAEDGTSTNSHLGVNPEEQFVPTQPLVAQPSTINALQKSGGAYAREYAACYYRGASVGPCASVVNSSTSPVPMPALSRSYAHTAVLSGSGVVPNVDNGAMTFTGGPPPSTLAGQTAVITLL